MKDECLPPLPNFGSGKCAYKVENSLPKAAAVNYLLGEFGCQERSGEREEEREEHRLSKARYKNVMLFAEVACGGRDDRPFAEEDLPVPLHRLTHIVFTHELRGLLR
jgi:hypothetical protein